MNRKAFIGSLFALPLAAKALAKKAAEAHAEKKPITREFYFLTSSSRGATVTISTSNFRWGPDYHVWEEGVLGVDNNEPTKR